MPRFNEQERAVIQQKLFTEGERLFVQHGMKKVTVDDLVKAAGIAKGSFYAFYTNKEHLYFDILSGLQNRILGDTDEFLQKNRSLLSKELVKRVILWSYDEIKKYPLLMQHDSETTDCLYRKLSKEILESQFRENMKTPAKLMEYGVTFKCDLELAEKVIQGLTLTFFNLRDKNNGDYHDVIEIIVTGAVNEIVRD